MSPYFIWSFLIYFTLNLFIFYSSGFLLNETKHDNYSIDLSNQKFQKLQNEFEKINLDSKSTWCSCDFNANYCDLECCCDQDCTEAKKYSFGKCQSLSSHRQHNQPKMCHTRESIWNREILDLSRSSQLLCFSKDNSKQNQWFSNKDLITDYGKFALIKTKHEFQWNANKFLKSQNVANPMENTVENINETDRITQYKSGNKMIWWTVNTTSANSTNYSYQFWKLPASFMSFQQDCNHLTQIRYMYNFQSFCRQNLQDLPNSCLTNKYFDADIYYKSMSFLQTNISNDNYRMVKIQIEGFPPKVYFDSKTNSCKNVVESVEYTVWHHGVFGITKVLLRFHQVHLSGNGGYLMQNFSVNFKWSDEDQKSNLTHVNGGYLIGHLLVFSVLQENETREMVDKRLISTFRNGQCHNENKLHDNRIYFPINQFSVCQLALKIKDSKEQFCSTVEASIGQYLEHNITNLHVAAFANVTNSSLKANVWIPIINMNRNITDTKQNENCESVITSISYLVYYVRIGNAHQSTFKIIAIGHRKHSSPINRKCDKFQCELQLDIELESSVNFIDVTEPLRPSYAPPPSIKIQLPSDFFYPFLINSSNKNSPLCYQLVYCFVLMFFCLCNTTPTII